MGKLSNNLRRIRCAANVAGGGAVDVAAAGHDSSGEASPMIDPFEAHGRLLAGGWRRYGLNDIGPMALYMDPTSQHILPLRDALAALERTEANSETVQTQT